MYFYTCFGMPFIFALVCTTSFSSTYSNLIANVGKIVYTSSSLFTSTSLILDATNSPSNPLLITLNNLCRKLSNFCNKFPTSYDILSLKLYFYFRNVKPYKIYSCLVVCLLLVGIHSMNCEGKVFNGLIWYFMVQWYPMY